VQYGDSYSYSFQNLKSSCQNTFQDFSPCCQK